MGLCNIAVEFKKSRKLSIMRISVQDERFALCSVIGVSLEEIIPDMKHICCQSWCVIFNVCGYLISCLQFSSLCAAFILLRVFFDLCSWMASRI